MSLLPEQIAQLRGQAGLSPTPPTPINSATNSVLAARKTAIAPPKPPKPTIGDVGPSIVRDVGKAAGAFYDFTSDVADNTADAQKQIAQGVIDTGKANYDVGGKMAAGTATARDTLRPAEMGLRGAGAVVGGLFAPVTGAVKSVVEGAANAIEPLTKGIANTPAVDAIFNGMKSLGTLAAKHPEATKDIQDIINILTLGAGKGVTSALDATVGDTFSGASKALISDVKTALPAIAQGTKDVAIATGQAAARVGTKVVNAADATIHPIKTIKNLAYGPSVAAQAAKGDKQLEAALEITSPTRYKKNSIATMETAGQPGGATKTGPFAPYKAVPTPYDIKVANAVKNEVSPNNGPLENIVGINEGIEKTSNALRMNFVKNKVPFNYKDFIDFFKGLKPKTSLKADSTAGTTYARVTEDLRDTAGNFLKQRFKERDRFSNPTNMEDVWDAAIAVDQRIKNELDVTVFESPEYIGVRAAAKDFRDSLREFIAQNIGNPGEMELVNRFRASLATLREKGIDIPVGDATNDALNMLRQQLGIKTTEEEAAARSAYFIDTMEQLHLKYEARGNIAESNWRLLDKNFIDRWMKMNPGRAKLLKYGIGIGIGTAAGAVILP